MASIPIVGTIMPDGKVVLSDMPEDDRYVMVPTPSVRLYDIGIRLDSASRRVIELIPDAPCGTHGDLSWLAAELQVVALRCYAASELVKDS